MCLCDCGLLPLVGRANGEAIVDISSPKSGSRHDDERNHDPCANAQTTIAQGAPDGFWALLTSGI